MIKKSLNTFWMSFCDPNKEAGQQFLGVIIIQGVDIKNAVIRTHSLHINPGGEIQSYEIEKGMVKSEHMDKLLSKSDLIEYGYTRADG